MSIKEYKEKYCANCKSKECHLVLNMNKQAQCVFYDFAEARKIEE